MRWKSRKFEWNEKWLAEINPSQTPSPFHTAILPSYPSIHEIKFGEYSPERLFLDPQLPTSERIRHHPEHRAFSHIPVMCIVAYWCKSRSPNLVDWKRVADSVHAPCLCDELGTRQLKRWTCLVGTKCMSSRDARSSSHASALSGRSVLASNFLMTAVRTTYCAR